MKNIVCGLFFCIAFSFFSCNDDTTEGLSEEFTEFATTDSGSSGNGDQGQAGLITAGEWNDLSNWEFWKNLLNEQDFSNLESYWGIYFNNRVSIQAQSNGIPVGDVKIELIKDDIVIWSTRTDNLGKAEVWLGAFQPINSVVLDDYVLKINGQPQDRKLILFDQGTNVFELNPSQKSNKVEVSFIVDATGSMSDELEFLKEDLKSVISQVENDNTTIEIATSTVFYRDEGDEYILRTSDFTKDIDVTIDFINDQSADGGGDFPEAVHAALDASINQLQWSMNAGSRIAFLLLDAPPHYTPEVLISMRQSIKKASEKGIKIIPITASGIDKKTEFLMRFISIITNGTYVFITNDSGIGNEHIEPSVGSYEVEKLNELMVRLIKKYTE